MKLVIFSLPVIVITWLVEWAGVQSGLIFGHYHYGDVLQPQIAGVPVAVTFCPLCNAAVVFKREVDGDVLRFGVSGNLRNSDLIMWDNKTLSWWQQFTGEGIVGDLTGTQLEMIPAQLVAWQDFKAAHPDGVVQARTGPRNYGTNPYTGYDSTTSPFLFLGEPDPRLRATERVLGYNRGDTAVAYPMKVLAREKVVEDTLDGQDVVIFYAPGQVSALDNARIDKSKEVGSAAMFIPEVDGQKLTFKADGNKIIDNETGSEWDVFGRAVAGELEGAQLKPVLSHVHFWFAWAAFKPDTVLYGS
ncbi:MAG: carotenoid biosynthesis protein [Chloroflexi bacterium]|nr:MAG: carotenoid biosynthesis protein [Chloroflexota bacterium]